MARASERLRKKAADKTEVLDVEATTSEPNTRVDPPTTSTKTDAQVPNPSTVRPKPRPRQKKRGPDEEPPLYDDYWFFRRRSPPRKVSQEPQPCQPEETDEVDAEEADRMLGGEAGTFGGETQEDEGSNEEEENTVDDAEGARDDQPPQPAGEDEENTVDDAEGARDDQPPQPAGEDEENTADDAEGPSDNQPLQPAEKDKENVEDNEEGVGDSRRPSQPAPENRENHKEHDEDNLASEHEDLDVPSGSDYEATYADEQRRKKYRNEVRGAQHRPVSPDSEEDDDIAWSDPNQGSKKQKKTKPRRTKVDHTSTSNATDTNNAASITQTTSASNPNTAHTRACDGGAPPLGASTSHRNASHTQAPNGSGSLPNSTPGVPNLLDTIPPPSVGTVHERILSCREVDWNIKKGPLDEAEEALLAEFEEDLIERVWNLSSSVRKRPEFLWGHMGVDMKARRRRSIWNMLQKWWYGTQDRIIKNAELVNDPQLAAADETPARDMETKEEFKARASTEYWQRCAISSGKTEEELATMTKEEIQRSVDESHPIWDEIHAYYNDDVSPAHLRTQDKVIQMKRAQQAFAAAARTWRLVTGIHAAGLLFFTGPDPVVRSHSCIWSGDDLVAELANEYNADVQGILHYVETIVSHKELSAARRLARPMLEARRQHLTALLAKRETEKDGTFQRLARCWTLMFQTLFMSRSHSRQHDQS
ncbi:hypothetical protein CONPUDRAFT_160024 [Coniophora puteana RWD-64-598 SS2]|uniref:Uncharacterized protein n=1 Tax=Coniophora puteana (strain RWD-64-598) TaxID=741705 RepID=R7SF02_CONPW|nr:uncharacterized protein CONPUDRAFT_160024 [Coniophora puteana RWD-64-598 SS2]EIW74317.1 hypothetical protein CONPUDRAFT_160024 [Coniophora puteana RWD-64-598 SS2]